MADVVIVNENAYFPVLQLSNEIKILMFNQSEYCYLFLCFSPLYIVLFIICNLSISFQMFFFLNFSNMYIYIYTSIYISQIHIYHISIVVRNGWDIGNNKVDTRMSNWKFKCQTSTFISSAYMKILLYTSDIIFDQ